MNSDKYDALRPAIKVAGGSVFINPGTGEVQGATLENAALNIQKFRDDVATEVMKESGLKLIEKAIKIRRYSKNDYGEGRYCFRLYYNGKHSEIQMPGWSLDEVRYMKDQGLNAWDFPRLYESDSSWLWCIAASCAAWTLLGKDDDTL